MTTHDPRLRTAEWRQLRRWILDRDRGACQIQGPHCTHHATQVDHITPRADGGDVYNPANLRAACRTCNMWLAAKRTNTKRWRYHTTLADYETRL